MMFRSLFNVNQKAHKGSNGNRRTPRGKAWLVLEELEIRAVPALVAAYNFDQGSGNILTDVSGNGNHGTISNASWVSTGKFGGALSFNGTNSLVTIPDAPSLHLTTGMTLEAWVKPTAVTSAWRDVIYKGNDNYYVSATEWFSRN